MDKLKNILRSLKTKMLKLTPIPGGILELPEYICVETKCFSRELAMSFNIPTKEIELPTNEQISDWPQISQSLPTRERGMQTLVTKSSRDVAVQCRRDWEDEWNLPSEPPQPTEADIEMGIYVSEKTSMFPNGMLECLICGEVSLTLPEHQGHVSLHCGPGQLCHRCGERLGNENLIKHDLICPALAKRKFTLTIKCPHPLCNSICRSDTQLHQHLKQHLNRVSYRCLKCKHFFKTTTSFLLHKMRNKFCKMGKCITAFWKHDLPRGRNDYRLCSVCLRRFSSEAGCLWHMNRCIIKHHRQLTKFLRKKNPHL